MLFSLWRDVFTKTFLKILKRIMWPKIMSTKTENRQCKLSEIGWDLVL